MDNNSNSTKRKITIAMMLLLTVTTFIAGEVPLVMPVQVQSVIVDPAAITDYENESESRKREAELEEIEELPYMKNKFKYRERPQQPLGYENRFDRIVADPGRQYSRKLTHMFPWEITELAKILEKEILAPRETIWRKPPAVQGNTKRGRPTKYDHLNRLVFVLEWLSSGETSDKAEFEKLYARTSILEDRIHILKAINKKLDQIQWPDAETREQLHSTYEGVMEGVVGIMDCTEWEIAKPNNREHENETYSGKAGANTKKTLSVIDKNGLFIYCTRLINGRRNDREQWTSCELYMNAGDYFSHGEKVASDGGFRGDGPQFVSYDILDTESKKTFNLAFKEVRVGVENAFGRVQKWFPLLGIEKRWWPYDEELLELATGAAMKLHNWLMRKRNLSYNAQNDPLNHLRDLY